MVNRKRYEVLDALPVYGPMYIPVPKDGEPFYSQGFVVRFYKSDGSEWIANFAGGLDGVSDVYQLQEENKFAVFANGKCYIMSSEHTKPLDCFGIQFDTVFISNHHQLLAVDLTSLTVIEPNGEHWDSDRISWDGFKDLTLCEDILSGFSYDPMNAKKPWVPFTFNLKTRLVTGGSYSSVTAMRPE
jgi:hypothetical protein